MIGRLRAVWDDSRRTANHRRGPNPMSRTEWLDVVETINSLPTPDSDLDRYLAGIAAQEEKSDAEYQEFLRLRRPSADRDDTDATPFTDAQEARIREHGNELFERIGNLIARTFGVDGVKAEFSSGETETGADDSDSSDDATDIPVDVGCSAQVMLAGHVIDVTLTQNEYTGAVTMSINLPDGPPVWRTMTLGELRLR